MRPVTAAALAAVIATSACLSDRPGSTAPDPAGNCTVPAGAVGPGRAVVFIRGFAFAPDTLTVAPGTRVTWVNCEPEGTEAHTATADGGGFDSSMLLPGQNYSVEFGRAGVTPYFCRPHPFMRGVIRVEAR